MTALSKIDTKPWFDLMYLPSSAQLAAHPSDPSERKQMLDDPLAAVERVRVPLLLVYGGEDPWIPVATTVERLRSLVKGRPNVEYAVVAGVDHDMRFVQKETMEVTPAALASRRAQCAGLLYAARIVADAAPRLAGAAVVRRPCAVLFDRDETVVVDVPFNGDPERVEPAPNARVLLDRLRAAGLPLAIVSNQSGIGRGYVTAEQVDAVNRRVDELLGPFAGFFVCPHAPEDACECRKPKAKLILDAARALGVEPACCVVVGDRESDVEAARNAGAIPFKISGPAGLGEAVGAILAALSS